MAKTTEKAVSNEEIIAALLNSSTLTQAAQAADISPRALYDRMGQADFRAQYRAAKAAILRGAVNNISNRLAQAIDTTAAIMEDESNNPAIRLQAAQTILNHAGKFLERLDTADRQAEDARGDLFTAFV